MYKFLDYFFTIFHTVIILFNISGWALKKTRKIHFISITLTALAWFGLGIFCGIGYCPLTEWHFQVLRKLEYHDLPYSYIEFLIERMFPVDVNSKQVDIMTMTVFLLVMLLTVFFNYKDLRKKRTQI